MSKAVVLMMQENMHCSSPLCLADKFLTMDRQSVEIRALKQAGKCWTT